MPGPQRIIDANANRAREAIRVLEDVARFELDAPRLSGAAKSLRHDLVAALAPLGDLTAHRDTAGDVGTTITTEAEGHRADLGTVAEAAAGRLTEALRAIEEASKILDPDTARAVEALRYRAYELEPQLKAALRGARGVQWTLCLLLTDRLCQRPWRDVAGAALDAGADCIQLREKDLDDRAILDRIAWLLERAAGRAAIIVNDRADLAVTADADGVHLGQNDLPVAAARCIVGPRGIIGVSTSCLSEARAARDDGADLCGIGPMFPTTTKQKDLLAGPEALRAVVEWNHLPHLAIGGITAERLPELRRAGVRGIAVSSAICAAADPGAATAALMDGLATT